MRFSVVFVDPTFYIVCMRAPRDIDLARASVRSAKQKLDDALSEYGIAVSKYHEFVERKMADENDKTSLENSLRLPKGQVQDLVRLAFSSGGLAASRFNQVVARLEILCGRKISEATIRQTLYRMEQQGELERYSGRWSAGQRLINPT